MDVDPRKSSLDAGVPEISGDRLASAPLEIMLGLPRSMGLYGEVNHAVTVRCEDAPA